jgi:hypothetical protein
MEEAHKQVTTGQPLSPAFPARWFTTYSAFSPVRPGFVVTVAREIFHALGTCIGAASARFPKFARHRSGPCRELRKAKGTRDSGFSSAAFDLKFLSLIRGNFRRNFKSAALRPHGFAVREKNAARRATHLASTASRLAFVTTRPPLIVSRDGGR